MHFLNCVSSVCFGVGLCIMILKFGVLDVTECLFWLFSYDWVSDA